MRRSPHWMPRTRLGRWLYVRRLKRRMRPWLECPHEETRPNPDATAAIANGWNPRICNACGIGVLYRA